MLYKYTAMAYGFMQWSINSVMDMWTFSDENWIPEREGTLLKYIWAHYLRVRLYLSMFFKKSNKKVSTYIGHCWIAFEPKELVEKLLNRTAAYFLLNCMN